MKIFIILLKNIVTGFLKRLAIIQKTILLSLIYFLLIGPFKIVTFILRINLLGKRKREGSYWQDKAKVEINLDTCRRLS